MGNKLHYYAGDHTAKGFYTFYRSNFQGLDTVYILKGKSPRVKTDLMKKLADTWNQKGFNLEMIHSSSDNSALDGVIFPSLKTGIYDGSLPSIKSSAGMEKIIDVDAVLNLSSLQSSKNKIEKLNEQINQFHQSAHQSFETGLNLHDDLEKVYIVEMSFEKANQITEEWRRRLFAHKKPLRRTAQIKQRFFGASTPEGVLDYITNLTEHLSKRYFIKGRAGTGKSTMLKKIAGAAVDRGYDIELYFCGFDPESLDMVVVRDLDFCIFDSTDPHEHFPSRKGDEIIDLYEKTVTPGTDERYASEIATMTQHYKSYMKEGSAFLKEAKTLQDQIEQLYEQVTDQRKVDALFHDMNQKLQKQEAGLH